MIYRVNNLLAIHWNQLDSKHYVDQWENGGSSLQTVGSSNHAPLNNPQICNLVLDYPIKDIHIYKGRRKERGKLSSSPCLRLKYSVYLPNNSCRKSL